MAGVESLEFRAEGLEVRVYWLGVEGLGLTANDQATPPLDQTSQPRAVNHRERVRKGPAPSPRYEALGQVGQNEPASG